MCHIESYEDNDTHTTKLLYIIAIDNASVIGWITDTMKITDIKIYTKIMKIYNAFNECNTLTDHQILFKIIHIKSHVATVINGNDLADILAKAAMLKLFSLSNNANNKVKTITKDIYHGNERSYKSVANDNKRHFITQNQFDWQQHMTSQLSDGCVHLSNTMKPRYPQQIYKYEENHLSLHNWRIIHKLRSGHFKALNAHNKASFNKQCTMCTQGKEETIQHYVMECGRVRSDLFDQNLSHIQTTLRNHGILPNIMNILYPFEKELKRKDSNDELLDLRIKIINDFCSLFSDI